MKQGRIIVNPDFSSINRVGEIVEVLELKDEYGKSYKAVKDKRGVSWPLLENQVERL